MKHFPVLIVGIEIEKQHEMFLYNKHMILCNSLSTSLILIFDQIYAIFYFLGLHKFNDINSTRGFIVIELQMFDLLPKSMFVLKYFNK